MTGYKVPRWLHRQVHVEASTYFRADPDQFANETAYKWKLYGLSVVGSAATGTSPFNSAAGGLKNRIMVEVGKSGCSDMNLVPGVLGAFCGVQRRVRQTFGIHNDAASFNFFSPVRIPRDGGLNVKIQNGNLANTPFPRVTFIAKGVTDSGVPMFFGGESIDGLASGADHEIKSADLMNRGKEAVWLHTMCLKVFQINPITGTEYDGSLRFVHALINPVNGIRWMPIEVPIPIGNIMPLSQVWNNATDLGPCCYWFPDPTYLWPEQHLSIVLSNLSDARQTVELCLFGELEVV